MTPPEEPRRFRQRVRRDPHPISTHLVWHRSCECGEEGWSGSLVEAHRRVEIHRAEHEAVCPLRLPEPRAVVIDARDGDRPVRFYCRAAYVTADAITPAPGERWEVTYG